MEFRYVLQNLKNEHKMTNEQIGNICGTSESAVRTWLNGTKTPSISVLECLSNHFGLTADYLLGKNKSSTVQNGDGASAAQLALINKIKTMNDAQIDALDSLVVSILKMRQL